MLVTTQTAVGNLADIPPGEGREFDVGRTTVAIFRTRDDQVFATQPKCPHRGGPLRDGLIDGATIICPLHDRTYELHTGRGVGNECSLRTYPVRVADDGTLLLTAE